MPSAPTPRLPGRYAATDEDGTVHVWCQDHPEAPLVAVTDAELDGDQVQQAMREHDAQFHEEDRIV